MRAVAKASLEGGADGIVAVDTVKSVANVDLGPSSTARAPSPASPARP